MQIDCEVLIDTAQKRVKRPRIACVIGALDEYSTAYYSDVYVEKSAGTAILYPAPMRPAWNSSFTGINARLAKTDFTLTAASWIQRALNGSAGDYVLDLQGANETVITAIDYDANQAWFVKWFVYGSGNDNFTQMECGMNSTATGAGGISFRLNPTGRSEVWKDGVLQGIYNFCGEKKEQQIVGRYVWAIIIPGLRRNGVLVITSEGGEFIHYFDDLDETDPATIVTPSTKFWWYVASGQAAVQVAPVYYPDSGYVCSKTIYLAEVPGGAEVATSKVVAGLNGGTATAQFVKRANVALAYDPADATVQCRMRLDLGGVSGKSPFVYGAMVEYPALYAFTSNEPLDLKPWVTELHFAAPESAASSELSVTFKNPTEIEDAGATLFRNIENRPLNLTVDGVLFWDGIGQEPQDQYHWNPEAEHVTTTFRDPWALLDDYVYRDPKIWDGDNFATFVENVLEDAGVFNHAVQTTTYTIPDVPPGNGRFNCKAERGEKASQVLQRGFEAYAGLWLYFFRPEGGAHKFIAGDDSTGGTFDPAVASVLTLYATIPAAKTALTVDATEARARVWRDFHEAPLPIEANFVKITGASLATGDPIEVQKSDYASMDPATTVALRPENWLGSFRPLGIYNRFVTSLDLAQRACEAKYDKVTKKYYCCEFDAPFLVRLDVSGDPLWKGHKITIEGKGDYRILSVSAQIKHVNNGGMDVSIDELLSSAPAHYTAIKL